MYAIDIEIVIVSHTSKFKTHLISIDLFQTSKDKNATKKIALTKNQKKRQLNRMDEKGQMPRGWNWIDVVKHLRQTGGQQKVEE